MLQRVVTTMLILLALAGAVVGYQASANSAGPFAVLSDDDDRCDEDNSGPGSGGDDCDDDDDDDSGRGRGRGRGRGGDDDDAVPPVANANEAAADDVVVRIVDRSFSPANVTVTAGQTVTFVNEDDDEHTATSDAFDTGTIAPGGSASITLDTAGTFDFMCIFHPEMQGTVTVEGDAAATPAASPTASPAASPAASLTDAATTVEIVDFAFNPATIEVPAGTTVTWTNGDVVPHTATADDGSFETGRLNNGQRGSITFDEPGTFAYHCDFHANMAGEIVVR